MGGIGSEDDDDFFEGPTHGKQAQTAVGGQHNKAKRVCRRRETEPAEPSPMLTAQTQARSVPAKERSKPTFKYGNPSSLYVCCANHFPPSWGPHGDRDPKCPVVH